LRNNIIDINAKTTAERVVTNGGALFPSAIKSRNKSQQTPPTYNSEPNQPRVSRTAKTPLSKLLTSPSLSFAATP
jgi:hypothetical protein